MAEPGDRSIPPDRITMVEPTAMIATIETCSTRLLRFPKSTKAGRRDGDHECNQQAGAQRPRDLSKDGAAHARRLLHPPRP